MKKICSILFIFFFSIFLSISTIGWFLGRTSSDTSEHRLRAKLPSFDIFEPTAIPKKFEGFINDNFGFRTDLINFYTWVKINLFRSPPFKTEILGKDNWIFFNPVDKNDFKNWYKQVEFSNDELERIKNRLEAEKNWLAARKIPYLVVIVPDKEDIYPEYYPYGQKISDIKLNQFLEYMQKNSNVNILYLKQALLDAKKEYKLPLYYLYDTHWNELGAFIGYQEIMKFLRSYNPTVQSLQKEDFDISEETFPPTNMLDLIRGSILWSDQPEIRVHIKVKDESKKKIKQLRSVFVYGDSFAHAKKWPDAEREGLYKFLNFDFNKFSSLLDSPAFHLEYADIENDKPEIVFRELIQRSISLLGNIYCDEILKCY